METVSPDWALFQRADRLHLASSVNGSRESTGDPERARRVAATDAELVRDALAGYEAAFRDLVCRYERPVFSLIVRLTGNPSRAEELAQDTFVKAFQHLHTYERDRKLGTWLLAIAHHAAVDELRRVRIEPESLDEAGSNAAAISDASAEMPDEAAERAELADTLDVAIGRLRPEYVELVVLRYQEELTLDEIAEITALPMGTIKSYLHRARKELAGVLSAAGWRP